MEKIILEKDVILPNKETIEVYNLGTVQQPRYVVHESRARKELSTHNVCESCGNNIIKNSYCHPCYESKNNERYLNKEFKEWDGKTPLVIYNSDEYFTEEYLPENFDDLGDFDKGLVQKIKELNEYIGTLKPMSWNQGRYRTEFNRK